MTVARALFLLCLFAATSARATEVGTSRAFGLGFQAGSPTGVTLKSFIEPGFAFDLGIGWNGLYRRGRCWDSNERDWYNCGGWDNHNVTLNFDLIWERSITSRLHWHVGSGGRLVMWKNDNYYNERGPRRNSHGFIRMPVGLDWTFQNSRGGELFIEAAPNVLVVPFDVGIDVVMGARYYFALGL